MCRDLAWSWPASSTLWLQSWLPLEVLCWFMAAMVSTASHQKLKDIKWREGDKGWSQFRPCSMYHKTTLMLIMHCSLHTSANCCHGKPVIDFVQHLLGHMPQDALSDALDQYRDSETDFTSHKIGSFRSMLIEYELYVLNPFVMANRSWSQTFIHKSLPFCGINSRAST